MALSDDRKKLIERIAKLLALAESTTFSAEAAAAREVALRLMAEHNVRDAEAKAGQPFELRLIKPYFREDVWHERTFKWSVARLNNCFCVLYWGDEKHNEVQTHGFVARSGDLDAFEYMYGIALRQRTEAWNKYKAGGGEDSKGKWLYGYARGVEYKVAQILEELRIRMKVGRNSVAALSLERQAEQWFEEKYGKVGYLDGLPTSNSTDGVAAGGNINLYRGEVGSPTRRLNQPAPRITYRR